MKKKVWEIQRRLKGYKWKWKAMGEGKENGILLVFEGVWKRGKQSTGMGV